MGVHLVACKKTNCEAVNFNINITHYFHPPTAWQIIQMKYWEISNIGKQSTRVITKSLQKKVHHNNIVTYFDIQGFEEQTFTIIHNLFYEKEEIYA